MARMTTYNPRKVTCALGNHIVTGFAEAHTFLTSVLIRPGTTWERGWNTGFPTSFAL